MAVVDDLAGRIGELERSRAAFLDALHHLGEALASTHDRPELIGALLRTTARFLDAPVAVFYVSVAGTERLRAADAVGVEIPLPDLGPGEGLAGATSRAWDVRRWPADAPDAVPSGAEPAAGASTALAVPVRSGGHRFGVLAYYGRNAGKPYVEDDLASLSALVRQAETAIDASFLYEETRRLSLTDGMTGLWNRRQFDLRIEQELSRAVRFAEPFSVLFCDLDDLKPINDTYGHQAGDTVLIETARRLTDATREVDIVARFGGDEFTLLLPKTALAGALRLAAKIHAAVGWQPFNLDDSYAVDVSVSVGVASYPEHGSSTKELLAAADGALYRAKAAGGDRVEHAKSGDVVGGER